MIHDRGMTETDSGNGDGDGRGNGFGPRIRIVSAALAIFFCPALSLAQAISIDAAHPTKQVGSQGRDEKKGAHGGVVLGLEFGAKTGHFAEYAFENSKAIKPARISVRYARAFPGRGNLEVTLDGKAAGVIRYESTGGWGDSRKDFRWASVDVPDLAAGKHALRFTVAKSHTRDDFSEIAIPASPVLDRVGGRDDKNSVGHGANVALYTGKPSRFFYATHELGDVFSVVDGGTLRWYPDHVIVSPQAGGTARANINLDRIVISTSPEPEDVVPSETVIQSGVVEQRQVCVTQGDVVISKIHLSNPAGSKVKHVVTVTGDCRASRNWRGKPGGDKLSRRIGHLMVLVDKNVFPEFLGGLSMVVGGDRPPSRLVTGAAGTYHAEYVVDIPARSSATMLLACAFDPNLSKAQKKLFAVLEDKDPIATNRRKWEEFYTSQVPRFDCSDPTLAELYAFRWFLLRFSTAGGDLGYFKYPVVLEGRQAYQTYCCYSAPFMAFDLNWAVDPQVGYGHIASMVHAAYKDGRLPWYTAPNTNRVPVHHRSRTGLSLLPLAAWKHYLVHGSKERLREVYPGLKKNVDWWVKDRDPDGDGLFVVDHQLETGMDDLMRWPAPTLRYEAVDASSYAYANLKAVASMAAVLDETADAKRLEALAAKTAAALKNELWDATSASWRDRHPETKALSKTICVTTFYPCFAGVGEPKHLDVFRKHLFDPEQFWLPHPVPALPKNHSDFNPTGFWRGPSWPAATSHVVEGCIRSAKLHDRSLLPKAAELFKRAARNHLRPRADFYERYQPISGEPLSAFRDYMHSWWIDVFVRHVVGLTPRADGSLSLDPLPLGLAHFSMKGIPQRGHTVDVVYKARPEVGEPSCKKGLTVRIDGEEVIQVESFEPGAEPVVVPVKFVLKGD